MIIAVDITEQLQLLFDNISNVYSILSDVFVFTAFGFEFSMLGLILSLLFLIILIKAMRFGFGSELSAPIHFSREENKGSDNDGYIPKHAKNDTYYPRHAKDDE